MDSIERLFHNWIVGKIARRDFLERLEIERARARGAIRRWWCSPPAFEAHWNDLGGFDEALCEQRVDDNFNDAYSAIVRKVLKPALHRRLSETPEMRLFFKEMKPILLSDLYRRAEAAETIEDVYFLLGDDLTHWLIVHLSRYLGRHPKA